MNFVRIINDDLEVDDHRYHAFHAYTLHTADCVCAAFTAHIFKTLSLSLVFGLSCSIFFPLVYMLEILLSSQLNRRGDDLMHWNRWYEIRNYRARKLEKSFIILSFEKFWNIVWICSLSVEQVSMYDSCICVRLLLKLEEKKHKI